MRTKFFLEKGKDCPLCGKGTVIKRKGKYGDFWGCDRFPSCGLSQSIKEEKSPLEKQADDILERNGIDPNNA